MTELKPCPFCGSRDVKLLKILSCYSVMCNQCNSTTDDYFDDEKGALEAWNKRPSPWHTGTPTEDGWYLVWMGAINGNFHERPAVVPFENGDWASHLVSNTYVAWQKIEPFEASTD